MNKIFKMKHIQVVFISGILFFIAQIQVSAQNNSIIQQNTTIYIADKPQKTYSLELKNGKPFEGFEVLEKAVLGEFPLVNYYEKGVLKAQYSVDFFKLIKKGEDNQFPTLDRKTTFLADKIVDGFEYKQLNNNILMTNSHKNGLLSRFDLDLFGMHYYNQLSFHLNPENITIKSFDTNEEIQIAKENGLAISTYLKEGQIIASLKEPLKFENEGDTNTMTVYYLDKNQEVQHISMNYLETRTFDAEIENQFLYSIFTQFAFPFTQDLAVLFDDLHHSYQNINEDEFPIGDIFQRHIVPFHQKDIKSVLQYDSVGMVSNGTKIIKNNDGTYTATTYQSGEVSKTEQIKDIKSFTLPE